MTTESNEISKKPRVLVLSALVPVEKSGAGCLTMFRHFVVRRDFEVGVAAGRDFDHPDVPHHCIKSNGLIERVKKTRFTRLARNVDYLLNWFILSPELVKFAREFAPDVIFSVVDDLHMGIAWKLSRKLKIPLAVDFQDLFALSTFIDVYSMPYAPIKRFLLNRYRFLNRSSELVFHVGPGMREWFTDEERGLLLYPMADGNRLVQPEVPELNPKNRIVVCYTGNCRGPYGRMVCRFAKAVMNHPEIDFRIYSLGSDIPAHDLEELERSGIYRGYLPFSLLKQELTHADAYLLVMSYEPEDAVFVGTSFNTKWVDYVTYSKPIFVWGPPHSSASRFGREEGAAAVVDADNPDMLIDRILEVMQNPVLSDQFSEGSQRAAKGVLDPSRLQALLVEQIQQAIIDGSNS